MPRILSLDVGEKTIGVAVSDETGSIAFPGDTILRKEGWKRDMAALRALIADRDVRLIVVGKPLMLSGAAGIQSEKVDLFVARLRGSVRVPIVLQDERLTSREAEYVLIQADLSRTERKRFIDSNAACLILQRYLDSLKADTALDFEAYDDSEALD